MYWNKEKMTEQLASLPSSLEHSESAKSCRILNWVLKHLNVSAWLCFPGYLCHQDTSCTQLLICHASLGIVGQESMDQLCCCLAVSGSFATPWTVAHQSPLSMGFFWARLPEWVAISSSQGSSWPRDWTCVSASPAPSSLPLSHWGSPVHGSDTHEQPTRTINNGTWQVGWATKLSFSG